MTHRSSSLDASSRVHLTGARGLGSGLGAWSVRPRARNEKSLHQQPTPSQLRRCRSFCATLPPMASAFAAKKHRILQQLAQPAAEYSDASPKGSIDEGIRTLIDEINAIEGLVTTSSCAGRISAFLEGRKRAAASEPREAPAETSIAGAGGKGGGQWLFVSHEPVPMPAADAARAGQHFTALFGLDAAGGLARAEHHAGQRHVHLKFEAMVRPPSPLESCSA